MADTPLTATRAFSQGLVARLALTRYLRRRVGRDRGMDICRRRSDGTLWAAWFPQNFGLCMAGLFSREVRRRDGDFHFVRVREWRGRLIAARRVFWRPGFGDFEVIGKRAGYYLPAWPEDVESAKIVASRNAARLSNQDPTS